MVLSFIFSKCCKLLFFKMTATLYFFISFSSETEVFILVPNFNPKPLLSAFILALRGSPQNTAHFPIVSLNSVAAPSVHTNSQLQLSPRVHYEKSERAAFTNARMNVFTTTFIKQNDSAPVQFTFGPNINN